MEHAGFGFYFYNGDWHGWAWQWKLQGDPGLGGTAQGHLDRPTWKMRLPRSELRRVLSQDGLGRRLAILASHL